MATLTAQSIADAGTTPTCSAAADGDVLGGNTGRQYLEVKNASGSGITVTVTAVTNCNHGFLHSMSVSVAATTGDKLIGPFPVNRFGTAPVVSYSAVTSVTAAYVTL